MTIHNFLKITILVGLLTLLTAPISAGLESEANISINKIYNNLNHKKFNIFERITDISAKFLGKPYFLGALGEGQHGDYNQLPLYRTDVFDCETYVDTVLALAFASNIQGFKNHINQIRYRDGRVAFIYRNHFTCLDWNLNNQHEGFVKDITTTIHDKHNKSIVKFARALINKPGWYDHMSTSTIQIPNLDENARIKLLKSLKREGSKLPKSTSIIPYIPLTALFDKDGKENNYLFEQIPNASIIEIIRPNWDLSKEIGTNLNVSHLGFAIWENDKILFRQASSTEHKVIDVPLIDYLRNTLKSPTIKGINVQVVLP